MKLSKIYKRYTLITLILVLLIGSISHFLVLTHFVHHSADHTLREYRQNIEQHQTSCDTLNFADNTLLDNSRITWCYVADDQYVKEYLRDTMIYNDYKKEQVVFRLLSYTTRHGNANLLVTLWQVTLDSEDILWAILVSLIILFILFFLFYFWLTKWFVGRLWQPFYQILKQLKEVDLINPYTIEITGKRVDEFNLLNNTLQRMLNRIHEDYISLRELTETTSHELQTPLSIVKARLELLQQGKENSEHQTELIQSVSNAVDRAIRLNHFMLIIAKINNDQFPAEQRVVLNDFINDFLNAFEDVIAVKRVEIRRQYIEPMVVDLHPQLAEILISNLLSNAIRYNIVMGYIYIETTATTLKITNSYGNILPSGDLFVRFKKSTASTEATGLGLAIVRSICQKNNLEASVDVSSDQFSIQIASNN
ncbi:MAG: HAMP domain-containing sensor histidine kinase [Alistipes sp.]